MPSCDIATETRNDVVVGVGQETALNVALKLARKASVIKDLAAVGEYAENLVGVADSATEGGRSLTGIIKRLKTVPSF